MCVCVCIVDVPCISTELPCSTENVKGGRRCYREPAGGLPSVGPRVAGNGRRCPLGREATQCSSSSSVENSRPHVKIGRCAMQA